LLDPIVIREHDGGNQLGLGVLHLDRERKRSGIRARLE
jgi:hypothetical protein